MLLEPLQVKTPVRYPVSLFLKHDAVDAMNLFGFRKRLNELIKTKQSEEKKKKSKLICKQLKVWKRTERITVYACLL